MASLAVPTTTRLKPICFKNVRKRSCRPRSSSTTNRLALLVFEQNVVVQSGFLDPPAAADLNGRNLSALYEIVDSRQRNPQVLGRLFYGKQIVNWSFAHSFGERPTIDHSDHFINYENWQKARRIFWSRGEAGLQ